MGGTEKGMKILIGGMLLLAVAFLLFVELWPFPADMDAHNLESGMKNAYTMLGSLVGVALVYLFDRKQDFSVKAVWWAQILKIAGGLALVLAVKEGLRAPLDALFGGHMTGRGVRYCLIVVMAGILWPMTFRYFSKLGKK